MSCSHALSQWETTVSTHLPHLSRPQARVLAAWSFGMVLAKSCGITSVGAILAPLLKQCESTVRQRLREWSYPSKRKKGTHRQAVEVSHCFASLLGWVLSWWDPGEQRLALAMDASTLSTRFTVLAISVLYRGLENRAQRGVFCRSSVSVAVYALSPLGRTVCRGVAHRD